MLRLVVFLSLVACIFAGCLFNSGVNGAGNLLADGANDPHWQVLGNPAVVVSPLNAAWHINTASAKWVSTSVAGASPVGSYDYTTTFTLSAHALSLGPQILGTLAADDTASIYLNSNLEFSSPAPSGSNRPWNTQSSFSIVNPAHFQVGTNTLKVTVSNSGGGPSGFLMQLASLCAVGDPFFVDLEGKRFVFAGEAGKVFHIFSDPFISVNSLFVPSHKRTQPSEHGTVMSALGVQWANHTLVLTANSVIDSSVVVALDGVPRAFTLGEKVFLDDSCVQLTWAAMALRLQTPHHVMDFELQTENNSHINATYFNLEFSLKNPDPALCGGLMGQIGTPSTVNAWFVTEDLLHTTAVRSKYLGKRMC